MRHDSSIADIIARFINKEQMPIEEAKVVVKRQVEKKDDTQKGVKQGRLIVKKREDANRGR